MSSTPDVADLLTLEQAARAAGATSQEARSRAEDAYADRGGAPYQHDAQIRAAVADAVQQVGRALNLYRDYLAAAKTLGLLAVVADTIQTDCDELDAAATALGRIYRAVQ